MTATFLHRCHSPVFLHPLHSLSASSTSPQHFLPCVLPQLVLTPLFSLGSLPRTFLLVLGLSPTISDTFTPMCTEHFSLDWMYALPPHSPPNTRSPRASPEGTESHISQMAQKNSGTGIPTRTIQGIIRRALLQLYFLKS